MELTSARKTRLAVAFFIGLSLPLLLLLLGFGANLSSRTHSHLIGDFPAFYAAASIVKQGLGPELYSFELQKEVQSQIPELANTGFSEGKFLAFAYPPWFAFLLAPLAFLSFYQAKLLWGSLMFGAILLSAKTLASIFKQGYLWTLAVFLGFAPLYSATIGGQNSALSLFLLIVTLYSPNRLLAGIAFGMSFYKPQFAGVVCLSILLRWLLCFSKPESLAELRRVFPKKFFLGASTVSFALVVGSVFFVDGWSLLTWLEATREFAAEESRVNLSLAVSLYGFLKVLNLNLGGVVGLIVAALFMLFSFATSERLKKNSLFLHAILFSPHTVYYDVSLILPALLKYFGDSWLILVILGVSHGLVIYKLEALWSFHVCGFLTLIAVLLLVFEVFGMKKCEPTKIHLRA